MYMMFVLLGYAYAFTFKVICKGFAFPFKRTPSNAVCAILVVSAWGWAVSESMKIPASVKSPTDEELIQGIAVHKLNRTTGEYYPVTFEELGIEREQP